MRNRYNHLPSYKYTDIEGVKPVLEKSARKPLRDYKIYGDSYQKTYGTKNGFNVDKFVELVKKYDTTAEEKIVEDRRCISFRNNVLYHKDFSGVVNFKKNKRYTWSMSIKHEENLQSGENEGSIYLGWIYDDEEYNATNVANGSLRGSIRLNKSNYTNFKTITSPISVAGRNVSQIGFSFGYHARWLIDLDSIQIEEGIEATEYEPFVPAPAPDYPQEIECVGDVTKNLFNIDKFVELIKKYDTTAREKIVNGRRCISFRNHSLYRQDFSEVMEFKDNKQYTWSMSIKHEENLKNAEDHGAFYMGWVYENEDYSKDSSGKRLLKDEALEFINIKFTSTFGKNISQIGFTYGQKARWLIDLDSIQIEEGVEATEYEPFGKYKIPISMRGKNYANINNVSPSDYLKYDITNNIIKATCIKNTAGSMILRIGKYSDFVGKTLNLSFDYLDILTSTSTSTSFNTFIQADSTEITKKSTAKGVRQSFSFTIPENDTAEYLVIRFYFGYVIKTIGDYIELANIQLEEDIKATEYSIYTKPKKYNIFLEEPLRKAGDCSDYIDFKNQKVMRHIKEIDISTLTWVYSSQYALHCSPIADGIIYNTIKTNSSLCTHFPLYVGNPSYMEDKKFQHPSVYSTIKSYLVIKNSDYDNATDFKNYLISLSNEGNPILLDYILATPIEEPIELPNIETNKYTNIFDTNTTLQPSNVIAQYYKKG